MTCSALADCGAAANTDSGNGLRKPMPLEAVPTGTNIANKPGVCWVVGLTVLTVTPELEPMLVAALESVFELLLAELAVTANTGGG